MIKNHTWSSAAICAMLILASCARQPVEKDEIAPSISAYADVTIERSDELIAAHISLKKNLPTGQYVKFTLYDGKGDPIWKSAFLARAIEETCIRSEGGTEIICTVLGDRFAVKPSQVQTIKVELSSTP